MVKRLLPLVAALLLVLTWALPALADPGDGLVPPPTNPNQTSLTDTYSPGSLGFYTPSGLKYMVDRPVNNLLSAAFAGAGYFVKWTGRALDYAWNFNITRWLAGMIDPVYQRFSGLVWGFGGLLFAFAGLWVAIKMFKGELSVLTVGLVSMVVVLALAVWFSDGIGNLVADAEDAFSELSNQIVAVAASPTEKPDQTVNRVSDSLYQGIILENWARANFTSLDAAKKPAYTVNGVAGAALLEAAKDEKDLKRFQGDNEEDLAPMYSDTGLRTRAMTVLTTWIQSLLVTLFLAFLSLVVLGSKGVTVLAAMALPFMLFTAAMPWFNGLTALKRYGLAVMWASFVKLLASIALATYLALLAGLQDAVGNTPGGWATVTLLIAATGLVMWFLGKPLIKAFLSLFFRDKTKPVATTTSSQQVTHTSTTAAQAAAFRAAGGYPASGGPFLPAPGGTTPSFTQAQAGAFLNHTITSVATNTTQTTPLAAAGGHLKKRHLVAHAATLQVLQPKSPVATLAGAAGEATHTTELINLVRDTRRLVQNELVKGR